MSTWSVIALSGMGLVLIAGFTVMPPWSTMSMLVIAVLGTIGFAFTGFFYLGEALVLCVFLGLVIRGGAIVVRCLRQHRAAEAHRT